MFLQNRREEHSSRSIVLCRFPSAGMLDNTGYLPSFHCRLTPCAIFYPYADDQRVVMRVVETLRIFLRESDYGAFSSCYLWYRARQLNILDHPKVSFTGFFGRPSGCHSSYDHSYVPYGGSWSFIIPSGVLLLRGLIHSLLPDEFLQLPLFNKSFNLLFQVVTIGCVMTVISMKMAILVP